MIFDVTFEESEQTFNVTFKEVEIIDNTRPVVIKPLEIIENGEYYAENIDGFNPVNVNVPLKYEEGYKDGYQASQDSITLQEKTIIENGEYETDEGFTGMSKVTVAVPIKEEQTKTVEITKNGTTEVVADEGKSMSKVTVNTNVAFEGDIGKPFIDTSKITDFSYFFRHDRINDQIGYLDTSNGTAFGNMFESCTFETHLPINTSKGQYFQQMYMYCSRLKTIPHFDTANGENFSNMFSGCASLETVSITTAKKNLSTNTFQGCTKLKNITIGEGWAVNIYLHYSNNLTVESLHGMIENLADLTGQTAKTFQIGATNLTKIDEEHINMLKAKNWNYS